MTNLEKAKELLDFNFYRKVYGVEKKVVELERAIEAVELAATPDETPLTNEYIEDYLIDNGFKKIEDELFLKHLKDGRSIKLMAPIIDGKCVLRIIEREYLKFVDDYIDEGIILSKSYIENTQKFDTICECLNIK